MTFLKSKCMFCDEIVKANGHKQLKEERKKHFMVKHTKEYIEVTKLMEDNFNKNEVINWKSIYEKYGDWWQ